MIEMAAPAPPGAAATWVPAALTAVAAIVGAWLVYRNATKANRITEQNALAAQQLEWTRQAMTEARMAKDDAKSATDAANEAERTAKSATRAAAAAEGRLAEVLDTTSKLISWISRVVRKAHEVDQSGNHPDDVRELLRVINGGPPEISLSSIPKVGE